MKKKFEMIGTFCDNCNGNLTLTSHISEHTSDKQLDFCDTRCYEEFLKRHVEAEQHRELIKEINKLA